MQKKQVPIIPKSMLQDLAVSQFPSDAAYEIRNMRIVTTGDNTSLCLVNERSNSLELEVEGTIIGTQVLNNLVILFITGLKEGPDAIYKLVTKDNKLVLDKVLYRGDLGFNINNSIETISIYETNDILKVYWVDGINLPRVINITKEYDSSYNFDFNPPIGNIKSNLKVEILHNVNSVFDGGIVLYAINYYNKNSQLTPIINISPLFYTSEYGRGLSPDGTLKSSIGFKIFLSNISNTFEYCRVYRIFRTSIDATPTVEIIKDIKSNSLVVLDDSPTKRIEFPKSNSATIWNDLNHLFIVEGKEGVRSGRIKDVFNTELVDNHWFTLNSKLTIKEDSLNGQGHIYTIEPNTRIECTFYSDEIHGYLEKLKFIHVTSMDDIFHSLDISTLLISYNSLIIYDNGVGGTIIDPTSLLYFGGNTIIADTFAHKDNTLFLGNITLEKENITKEEKDFIKLNSKVSYISIEGIKAEEDTSSTLDTLWVHNSNLLKPNGDSYFQKGEVYRVGVLLLSKTGKWSEVIYLGDFENPIGITPTLYNDGLRYKTALQVDLGGLSLNIKDNYILARIVCVFPTINDRNILCLGIVCPTVYNLKDRYELMPYAQSSWFARPFYAGAMGNKANLPFKANPWYPLDNARYIRPIDTLYKGSYLKSSIRDYTNIDSVPNIWFYLPSAARSSGEIYSAQDPTSFLSSLHSYNLKDFVETFTATYGLDERIITFHSPDVDLAYNDEIFNINTSDIKCRIVGYAPLKTTFSDINIDSTGINIPNFSGSIGKEIKCESNSMWKNISGLSLVNIPIWKDSIFGLTDSNYTGVATFPVYPWQRNGSLNNQGKTERPEDRKSLLKLKIMSNLRICLPTKYLKNTKNLQIDDLALWKSELISDIVKLKLDGLNITYKGNIDSIIHCDYTKLWNNYYGLSHIFYNTFKYFYKDLADGIHTWNFESFINNTIDGNNEDIPPSTYISTLQIIADNSLKNFNNNDSIPILYKSTSHAVFTLSNIEKEKGNYYFNTLPQFWAGNTKEEWITTPVLGMTLNTKDSNIHGIHFDLIGIADDERILLRAYEPTKDSEGNLIPSSVVYGSELMSYFLLAELYRDSENIINRFGGNTEEALANNTWNVVSKNYLLEEYTKSNKITLISDRGDTYFSRYDHLKTYARSKEDTNQIVDIVSFMCETKTNIDGRYDRNRGLKNNLSVSPTNFNLFNKVYSLKNDFIPNIFLKDEVIRNIKFPNLIVWSSTKTLGEEVDSWTNINSASVLDLDGDLGKITALKRFNNDIYAFQDSGISKIIFNPRVQINPSDGIPIEISNSGKVEGKLYITNKYGCSDKLTITDTPAGIYFIDNYNKGILNIGSLGIVNLSKTKNMYSWISKNLDANSKIKTLYDKINNEVYFSTSNEALIFNELLGSFSSFYDYKELNWILNVELNIYQVKNNTIWKLHGGNDYGKFFGENKSSDYSATIIANPEFQTDKVFDTVEFRTDGVELFTNCKTNDYPFHTLSTTNEYQTAESKVNNLKKKFRIWRWQIGRNNKDKFTRDRIRNPWTKITLAGNSNKEVRLYDLAVTYYT